MADNKTLRVLQKIREEMETLPGHLGMFYKDLTTGFEFGVHEDEAFLAASVIKFPLYLHVLEQIEKLFEGQNVEVEYVTHVQLKAQTHDCKAVIRTGETTPYANIILQAGCIFA